MHLTRLIPEDDIDIDSLLSMILMLNFGHFPP